MQNATKWIHIINNNNNETNKQTKVIIINNEQNNNRVGNIKTYNVSTNVSKWTKEQKTKNNKINETNRMITNAAKTKRSGAPCQPNRDTTITDQRPTNAELQLTQQQQSMNTNNQNNNNNKMPNNRYRQQNKTTNNNARTHQGATIINRIVRTYQQNATTTIITQRQNEQ